MQFKNSVKWRVSWFLEETTDLDECDNNLIRNFPYVSSVVAFVIFTINLIVSLFHVVAKFVLK